MKNQYSLILALFLVGTLTINGQKPALSFTEVIQVDSASKSELYRRAKLSIVNVFIDANEVLQIDDKEEGQLVAKGVIPYTPHFLMGQDLAKGTISFVIKIYVKEGRYKYEITDFTHREEFGLITNDDEYPYPKGKGLMNQPKSWYNRVWNDMKNEISVNIVPLTLRLKQGMTKPTEISKDDW